MKKLVLAVLIFIIVISFAVHAHSAEDFCVSINSVNAIWYRDQLASYYDYVGNCIKDPNTGDCSESKKNFVIRMMRQEMKNHARSAYVPTQVDSARNTANAYVDALDIEPD